MNAHQFLTAGQPVRPSPAITSDGAAADAMVRFEAVSKTYPAYRNKPSIRALRDLDFAIARGTITGVIGRSGAGLIEAASSFGATPLQVVLKVLIPEALPGLVLALTLAVVSLLGYSAMVGAVGGGGLGDLGIRYGYQRFMPGMMLAVVVVLISLVQTVQTVGDYLARRVNRRLRHR